MTEEINRADHLQTLEKGLKVIEAFEGYDHLTISRAAALTDISRPTARRVLLTLVNLGYAQMLDNRFYLTPKVLSLGHSYMTARDSWEITMTLLRDLSRKTNESCSIAKLVGGDIVYIGRVPADKILKISLNIGTRLPAYATSMGKLLIAQKNEAELKKYFASAELQPLTPYTAYKEADLRKEFGEIRKKRLGIQPGSAGSRVDVHRCIHPQHARGNYCSNQLLNQLLPDHIPGS